jgi:hypothetical protein
VGWPLLKDQAITQGATPIRIIRIAAISGITTLQRTINRWRAKKPMQFAPGLRSGIWRATGFETRTGFALARDPRLPRRKLLLVPATPASPKNSAPMALAGTRSPGAASIRQIDLKSVSALSMSRGGWGAAVSWWMPSPPRSTPEFLTKGQRLGPMNPKEHSLLASRGLIC